MLVLAWTMLGLLRTLRGCWGNGLLFMWQLGAAHGLPVTDIECTIYNMHLTLSVTILQKRPTKRA